MMRKLALAAAVALCLMGCSTPGADQFGSNDPYEAANRNIFAMNLKIDSLLLRPTAERYRATVPEGVRNGLHNALENLDLPATFANDILQGRPARAGETAGRFLLNSTYGAGGLFDVASRVGIDAHKADFGQTLAVWGIEDGPYVMLPLLGPSSPRDTVGTVINFAMDPTLYIPMRWHIWMVLDREYAKILDARARNLDTLDEIERDSLDFYATTRSLYRQMRENSLQDGDNAPEAAN